MTGVCFLVSFFMNKHTLLSNYAGEFGEFQTPLYIKMDPSMELIVAEDGKVQGVQLVDQIVEKIRGNPLLPQCQTKGRNLKIDRLTMGNVLILPTGKVSAAFREM